MTATNRLRETLLGDFALNLDLAVEAVLEPVREWELAWWQWKARGGRRRTLREFRACDRVRHYVACVAWVVRDWGQLGLGLEDLIGRLQPCRLLLAGSAVALDCLRLAVERGEDVQPEAWLEAGRAMWRGVRACEEEACRGRQGPAGGARIAQDRPGGPQT